MRRLRPRFDHCPGPSQYGNLKSGNLTQYESGSAAGWSMVAVFQMFPLTSLTKTGCPGSNSMWVPVEVLGYLLSNSSWILKVSTFLPIADGSCGRVE